MIVPSSPDGPCVDAARDSMYCMQDTQGVPKAAPRGHPPTPKPRSGIFPCFNFVEVKSPF